MVSLLLLCFALVFAIMAAFPHVRIDEYPDASRVGSHRVLDRFRAIRTRRAVPGGSLICHFS